MSNLATGEISIVVEESDLSLAESENPEDRFYCDETQL